MVKKKAHKILSNNRMKDRAVNHHFIDIRSQSRVHTVWRTIRRTISLTHFMLIRKEKLCKMFTRPEQIEVTEQSFFCCCFFCFSMFVVKLHIYFANNSSFGEVFASIFVFDTDKFHNFNGMSFHLVSVAYSF